MPGTIVIYPGITLHTAGRYIADSCCTCIEWKRALGVNSIFSRDMFPFSYVAYQVCRIISVIAKSIGERHLVVA